MRRETDMSTLSGSGFQKYILAAILLLSGWVISRQAASFTYRTKLIIRTDSLSSLEQVLPETYRDVYNVLPQNLEKTLLINALRNTGMRIAVHDLTATTPFRAIPEGYSDEERLRLRSQLAQYLREQDPAILIENQARQLVLKMGYDANSLFRHLKIQWKEDGNTAIISFSSEHALLSAFVVNDLCREIVRVQQEFLQISAHTEISVIQQQIQIMTDFWATDFDEERFTMQADGRRYWLHPHYPRLEMFEVEKNSKTRSSIKLIKELEEQQEIKLKEGMQIMGDGQNILRYLKKQNTHYTTDSYQTIERTIALQAARLDQLSAEISALDHALDSAHKTIQPYYGIKNWVVIPRRTASDSREYKQILSIANTMTYLSFNEASHFQQDIAQNNVRRIPNLLNFVWITLCMVILLHFAGFFKEKLLFVWAKEK
ncbi:MAG: hypothetical protein SF052_01395 [Bacteroidia bacterium]|nr:hypothetical protein [Bacteroidia bacterium]